MAGFLYTVICVMVRLRRAYARLTKRRLLVGPLGPSCIQGSVVVSTPTGLVLRLRGKTRRLRVLIRAFAPRNEAQSSTTSFGSVGSRRVATYSLPHTPAPPAYRSPEVILPQQNRTCNPPVRPHARPYQPKRMTDVREDTPSRTLVPLDNALGLQLHSRPNVLLPPPDIVERVKATRRELGMGRMVADRTRGVSAPPFLGV